MVAAAVIAGLATTGAVAFVSTQPSHTQITQVQLSSTPDERLRGHNPRYGDVLVSAWHGLHQKLAKQAGWAGFGGVLPIVAGTVIRIQVEWLPADRAPGDLWLVHTAPSGTRFDLDLLWKTYLRGFDLELNHGQVKHPNPHDQIIAQVNKPPAHKPCDRVLALHTPRASPPERARLPRRVLDR